MAESNVVELPTIVPPVPEVIAAPTEVAQIEGNIDIKDRAGISVYGDNAQQAVTDFADKILSEVRNKDMGQAGQLLTEILLKAKNLDPASLKDKGFLGACSGRCRPASSGSRKSFRMWPARLTE